MTIASDAKLSGSSMLSLSIGTLRAFQSNMNPTGLNLAGNSFATRLAAMDGGTVSTPVMTGATAFVIPEMPIAESRLMTNASSQVPLDAAQTSDNIHADAVATSEDALTTQPTLFAGDDRDVGDAPSLLALFAAIAPPQVASTSPKPLAEAMAETPGTDTLPGDMPGKVPMPSATSQPEAPVDAQSDNMRETAPIASNASVSDQLAGRFTPLTNKGSAQPTVSAKAERESQPNSPMARTPIDNTDIADKRAAAPSANTATTQQSADPVITPKIATGPAFPATISDGKSGARRSSENQTAKTGNDAAVSVASLLQTGSPTTLSGDLPDHSPGQSGDGQKPMTAMAAPASAQPAQAVPAWANALAASDAAVSQQVGATAPLAGAPSAHVLPAQATNAPFAMSPNPVDYDSGFIDRIGQEIAMLAKGPASVRLQIMPVNMGRIDIELQNDNGADRIRLITESENVRQTLAQSQGRLELELRQAGNRPAEVSVELRQNNSGQSNNSQMAGQNGNAGASSQNHRAQDAENPTTIADNDPTPHNMGESTALYA